MAWLAPFFAAALAAAPVVARLCEVRCAARASHCHEEAPKAPGGGCPEKSHRTESFSLAGTKVASAAQDELAAPIVPASSFIVPAASRPVRSGFTCVSLTRPDLASLRVLRL